MLLTIFLIFVSVDDHFEASWQPNNRITICAPETQSVKVTERCTLQRLYRDPLCCPWSCLIDLMLLWISVVAFWPVIFSYISFHFKEYMKCCCLQSLKWDQSPDGNIHQPSDGDWWIYWEVPLFRQTSQCYDRTLNIPPMLPLVAAPAPSYHQQCLISVKFSEFPRSDLPACVRPYGLEYVLGLSVFRPEVIVAF